MPDLVADAAVCQCGHLYGWHLTNEGQPKTWCDGELGCPCTAFVVDGQPDADAAREAFVDWMAANPHICNTDARSFLAGYAAGSARLDALHAENQRLTEQVRYWMNYGKGQTECGRELLAERDTLRDAIATAKAEALREAADDLMRQGVAATPRWLHDRAERLSEAGERP